MASNDSSSTAVDSTNSRAQAEARAAVIASLESAGSNHDSHFQQRAADIHSNAIAIANQEDEIKRNTNALEKEHLKWKKEADRATAGLKAVGHVQNWAELMERDFMVLEETMRLVEGGQKIESASGGSTWR